eukprot:comp21873_c0_seq1/m.31292 comp21873_c0_seq1/g.31292  ORF comp21873_c0_seq1/g.31292 comp21873_c0_seq1/m.31292 type:complete len:213 (-) comp21873_c0_seq1:417-1055(-)
MTQNTNVITKESEASQWTSSGAPPQTLYPTYDTYPPPPTPFAPNNCQIPPAQGVAGAPSSLLPRPSLPSLPSYSINETLSGPPSGPPPQYEVIFAHNPASATATFNNPLLVTCGHCQRQVVSVIKHSPGVLTWLAAGGLCAVGLWFVAWVPFVVREAKDAVHVCPSCGGCLAKVRRLQFRTEKNRARCGSVQTSVAAVRVEDSAADVKRTTL